jgi:hypothetical protein
MLLERWLEAYGQWPPGNQLLFSLALVVAALLMFVIGCLIALQMAYYIAVWFRGWPNEKKAEQNEAILAFAPVFRPRLHAIPHHREKEQHAEDPLPAAESIAGKTCNHQPGE